MPSSFELKENNLTGFAVIDQPGGITRGPETFITLYDYAMQYAPHLLKQLYYANGNGSITGLLNLLGNEGEYASDVVKHAEMNRLHNRLKNVAVNTGTNTFTSPTDHNLQPNMVILISDGVTEVQAVVDSVTNKKVFVALSKEGATFNLVGNVDISVDFTNSWNKGTGTFEKGNTWNPNYYENYTNIIKWRYDVSGSDLEHDIWLQTPNGPRWANLEVERSMTLFENLIELTHFFAKRGTSNSAAAAAGYALGSKSIVQQVEERGNICNNYIEDIDDLHEIAKRIKEQGVKAKEYFFFCDDTQMYKFNQLMSTVNAGLVNSGNYGAFNNDKEMALYLDFTTVMVSGITFHFKCWDLLDDPTIYGGGKFDTTGVAYIGVPAGKKEVKDESGDKHYKPYLSILYRKNRRRKVDIFGPGGTAQLEDKKTYSWLTETTNQVVGANAWFVGRRSDYYDGGSISA